MARKGLGRGLESILGDEASVDETMEVSPQRGVREIAILDIDPDPDQPRKVFDEDAIGELSGSIRLKGVLQPILLRPNPDKSGRYIIIAGERRWRAASRAALKTIPALIRESDAGETAELALIENIQRADLNPMEEADAYARIKEVYGKKPGEIADAVGKSRSHVANMLRLTQLPDSVKADVSSGELSMGHARALLGANDAVKLAEIIKAKDLSVRDVEALIRKEQDDVSRETPKADTPAAAKPSGGNKDADTKSLERDLEAVLGIAVAIEHTKKGGQVTLTYDTLEQLDDICRRLMGSAI